MLLDQSWGCGGWGRSACVSCYRGWCWDLREGHLGEPLSSRLLNGDMEIRAAARRGRQDGGSGRVEEGDPRGPDDPDSDVLSRAHKYQLTAGCHHGQGALARAESDLPVVEDVLVRSVGEWACQHGAGAELSLQDGDVFVRGHGRGGVRLVFLWERAQVNFRTKEGVARAGAGSAVHRTPES